MKITHYDVERIDIEGEDSEVETARHLVRRQDWIEVFFKQKPRSGRFVLSAEKVKATRVICDG